MRLLLPDGTAGGLLGGRGVGRRPLGNGGYPTQYRKAIGQHDKAVADVDRLARGMGSFYRGQVRVASHAYQHQQRSAHDAGDSNLTELWHWHTPCVIGPPVALGGNK